MKTNVQHREMEWWMSLKNVERDKNFNSEIFTT